jgi:hypothetical protein
MTVKASLALVALAFAGCCSHKPPETRPANNPAPVTQRAAKVADATEWKSLFDGTMTNWKKADFAGGSDPVVVDKTLKVPVGGTLSGVVYTGEVPKMNYEVQLEAMRLDGSDFFAGFTFPYGDSHASLIVGGWGGGLVGISSLDDQDAANNETTTTRNFESLKWYKIRVVVRPDRIQAWIGADGKEDQVVDVETTGRKVSTRFDIDESKPFGLATFQTTAAYRDIKVRSLVNK